MFILKHLKTLQHVSIIIQDHLQGARARTHTKCYAAASPHWLFTFLTNFKISDFNKEHTSSLKMILMMIETCWSVFKCFNMNILDQYFIVYRGTIVGVPRIRFGELKCTVKNSEAFRYLLCNKKQLTGGKLQLWDCYIPNNDIYIRSRYWLHYINLNYRR